MREEERKDIPGEERTALTAEVMPQRQGPQEESTWGQGGWSWATPLPVSGGKGLDSHSARTAAHCKRAGNIWTEDSTECRHIRVCVCMQI